MMKEKKCKLNEEIDSIAIIAGSGSLPFMIYEECKKKKIKTHIIGIKGEFSPQNKIDNCYVKNDDADKNQKRTKNKDYIKYIKEQNHQNLQINEKITYFSAHSPSKIIKHLKSLGVKHITMAGRVRRLDNIPKLVFDKIGRQLMSKILMNGMSDDSLLRSINDIFEENGLIIIPPQNFIEKNLTKAGIITQTPIPNDMTYCIEKGSNLLDSISKYDAGQGAVVATGGQVIGIEGAEGTQDLLKRCGKILLSQNTWGILIKKCKIQQDKRVDLPCIGPQTIMTMSKNRIVGVALSAESSIIIDYDKTLNIADEKSIFIYGIKENGIEH